MVAARLSALELGDQPAPVEQLQIGLGAISGVGPYTARQIVPVEKPAEFSAVGRGGVGHGETPYKPVSAVGPRAPGASCHV